MAAILIAAVAVGLCWLAAMCVNRLEAELAAKPAVALNEDGELVRATTGANTQCEAVRIRAGGECKKMMQETWYDAGAEKYPVYGKTVSSAQHDWPRCDNLANELFYTCTGARE